MQPRKIALASEMAPRIKTGEDRTQGGTALANLLYVDDNTQHLQAVQKRLELMGYRVLTAGNGAEALEIFSRKRIHLAVVDYYMHGLSGDMVAVEMKRLRPDVPIIIFSGSLTLPEMVIALVDGFVFTGEEPEKLVNKIKELMPPRKRKRKAAPMEREGAA
jgi:DNA-binding NtrC family response regulator